MIKRVLVVAAAMIIAMVASVSAFAGDHGGGHTPVTVCHKPGTPAQKSLTFDDDGYKAHIAHGDTLGPCQELPPVDLCPEEGIQTELPCEEIPPPPVDVCDNIEGVQTEGPCEETPVPPVTPPTHDCVFVGADKDGGSDAYGGTNDDCAPFPTVPSPVLPVLIDRVVTVTPLPTVVTTVVKVKPVVKPKPKKAKPVKAKPKKVKKVQKVTPKPDKPVVCKAGFRYTKKYGCTAAVRGSG